MTAQIATQLVLVIVFCSLSLSLSLFLFHSYSLAIAPPHFLFDSPSLYLAIFQPCFFLHSKLLCIITANEEIKVILYWVEIKNREKVQLYCEYRSFCFFADRTNFNLKEAKIDQRTSLGVLSYLPAFHAVIIIFAYR